MGSEMNYNHWEPIMFNVARVAVIASAVIILCLFAGGCQP